MASVTPRRLPSRNVYLHQTLEWRTFTIKCRKVGNVFWVLDGAMETGDRFYHEGFAYEVLGIDRQAGSVTRIRSAFLGAY